MNKKKLLSQKSINFKEINHKIIANTLDTVDFSRLITNHLKIKKHLIKIKKTVLDLQNYRRIHVIAMGKGSSYLYLGLKKILGPKISGGIVCSNKFHHFHDPKIKFLAGSHPLPDNNSLKAGEQTINYIKNNIKGNDLVFCLITGGASAQIVQPIAGITLADKFRANELLLASGANIKEINCVRKHLSSLKGGKLADLIYPAQIVTIAVSDIPDSSISDIGSGPSVGDDTSFRDAWNVLTKYQLNEKVGKNIKNLLLKGIDKKIPDTPVPDSKIFRNAIQYVIADSLVALKAAKKICENLKIKSHIFTAGDHGEAADIAKFYASLIKDIYSSSNPFKPPVLLLSGGELTVTLKGKGQGGPNQEFLLHLLRELAGVNHPFFISSIDTDGIDGPTDAAGAWIDRETYIKVKRKNLILEEYIKNNDAYSLFNRIDQLIKTGPTRINLMDMRIFYISK